MRLAPPPPDICMDPRAPHAELLRAVAVALEALERHPATAQALSALGDIELPPGAPNEQDRAALQAAGPLYFASELEQAGLLATAELVAGLFASGAVTQPLGPVAQQLHQFWRTRRERLTADERQAIFARVIEAPYFDRLLGGVCEAIVAQADGSDVREDVSLATRAQALGEFLAQRMDPMAVIGAREIVGSINTALGFMRDRMLQTAFGVNSLWALVAVARAAEAVPVGVGRIQQHVERGRNGQSVLLWLAARHLDPVLRLDPVRETDVALIGAAQRWLDLRPSPAASAAPSAAPALPADAIAA